MLLNPETRSGRMSLDLFLGVVPGKLNKLGPQNEIDRWLSEIKSVLVDDKQSESPNRHVSDVRLVIQPSNKPTLPTQPIVG